MVNDPATDAVLRELGAPSRREAEPSVSPRRRAYPAHDAGRSRAIAQRLATLAELDPTAAFVGQLPTAVGNVFALLLDGMSEKEIAKELARSKHTVHAHVKSIYRRANVQSRAELLSIVVRLLMRLAAPPAVDEISPGSPESLSEQAPRIRIPRSLADRVDFVE